MFKKTLIFFLVFIINISSTFSIYSVEKSEIYSKNGMFLLKKTNKPFTGMVIDGLDREFYKSGRPHGKWLTFYEDGNLRSIENWRNGILNGKHILYGRSEVKLAENTYTNGKEEGRYFLFHDNGKPYIIGEFKKGLPFGVWEYFDEDGKLIGTNNFSK